MQDPERQCFPVRTLALAWLSNHPELTVPWSSPVVHDVSHDAAVPIRVGGVSLEVIRSLVIGTRSKNHSEFFFFFFLMKREDI